MKFIQKNIWQLLLLLFVLIASAIGTYQVQKSQSIQSKAYEVSHLPELANSELSFIRAIYPRYANTITSKANMADEPFVRGICHQSVMSFLDKRVKQITIQKTDKDFMEFTKVLPYLWALPDNFTKPASATSCLLAANLAKTTLISQGTFDDTMRNFSNLAKQFTDKYTVSFFQTKQKTNKGDFMGEEIMPGYFTLTRMTIDPKYFPNGLTQTLLENRVKELIEYSYSQCGYKLGCPFEQNTYLGNNHQMLPHPIYTQSLFTIFAETYMVHKQLNLPWPSWLPLPPLTFTQNVANELRKYVDNNFHLTNTYKFISNEGTAISEGIAYANTTYNQRNFLPPNDSVDGFSLNYDPSTKLTRGYILKGDRIWHFSDDTAGNFSARYTKTLADLWAGAKFPTNTLPVDSVDAFNQFIGPNNTQGTLLIKGSNMYFYECSTNGTLLNTVGKSTCVYRFTRTLDQEYALVANRNIWATQPPSSSPDSWSVIYEPNIVGPNGKLGHLRVYLTKGPTMWYYRCSYIGQSCTAGFQKPISDVWSGANFSAGSLPSDRIDVLTQVLSANNGPIETYIIKDDKIYKYRCSPCVVNPSDAKGTYPAYLGIYLQKRITNQHVWPDSQALPNQYTTGVVDWGFDAAVQNSAYAMIALTSGYQPNVDRYQALLANQLNSRRLDSHPYFPTTYEKQQWNFTGNLSELRPEAPLYPLAEGFSTPSTDMRINSHWFFNELAGYNHTIAYLLLSNSKVLSAY